VRLTSRKWQVLIFLSIISILAGGCTGQTLPVKLESTSTVLSLGQHTNIECIVSNSTGNYTYEWSSDWGSIQGEGKLVDWLAPDSAGNYSIEVTVTGDNVKSGTASITITVADNHAPVIEDFVVTADHKYVKELKNYYKVGKDQMYHIECQAWDEDNDDLIYTWSCDNGEISGTGANITWKSPNVSGDVNITATVSDEMNEVATQDLLLQVVSCSPCTFK
jgi:hypothetical protein